MQKLKTFFYTFINSFKPKYYQAILPAKFSFSLKYFLFFNLILALFISVKTTSDISQYNLNQIFDEAVDIYPDDLVITTSKDGLQINQNLPYTIPFAPESQVAFNESKYPIKYLVTFDSDQNFQGMSNFYDRQSLAVVTESMLYIVNRIETGEVRVQPFQFDQATETYLIDKELINQLKDKILNNSIIKYKIYLPLIALLILIVVTIFMSLSRMVGILIYSLVILILVKILIKKQKLSYGKIYQLCLHSITLLIMIQTIADFIKTDLINSWLSILIMLGWTLGIINQLPTLPPAVKKMAEA